jgi:DNA primase
VDYDPVEMYLIQLMMDYPQKIMQVEREKILDFFAQPEIQQLGRKIIETYKLLGFIDLNVVLSDAAHSSLREKMYKIMMKNVPVDETMMEKIFADNIRQIKRKWYREQHRQIKIKLSKAQENGNQDLINRLIHEKENLMIQEKELH